MAKKCPTGSCGIMGHGIERILLGVDGSPGSKKAALKARDMALSFGAEVLVLHVLMPGEETTFVRRTTEGAGDVIGARLADAVGIMEDAKLLYETKVVAGNVAERILEVAEDEDRPYDLIVLGSKGGSMVGLPPKGGVALAVIQNSRVPVLVVP